MGEAATGEQEQLLAVAAAERKRAKGELREGKGKKDRGAGRAGKEGDLM